MNKNKKQSLILVLVLFALVLMFSIFISSCTAYRKTNMESNTEHTSVSEEAAGSENDIESTSINEIPISIETNETEIREIELFEEETSIPITDFTDEVKVVFYGEREQKLLDIIYQSVVGYGFQNSSEIKFNSMERLSDEYILYFTIKRNEESNKDFYITYNEVNDTFSVDVY